MEKIIINVPKGVRYISQWPNFNLPKGQCIVDKQVTGCGYTDYCLLTTTENVILCSPRKSLLENKRDQHPYPNIRYIENKQEHVDSYDSDEIIKDKVIDENLSWIQMRQDTQDFINYCYTLNPLIPNIKILVTYDSLKYVLKTLEIDYPGLNFYVIVDEFQNIFMDAQFKPSVELDFVDYLQPIPNVCYLSATPMLEEALNELDEFNKLPYYELNWPKEMTHKALVKRVWTKNLTQSAAVIINDYLSGNFPRKVLGNGQIKESHELTIFCNSVTEIIRIINKCNLSSQNTIVVCAETDSNRIKLRKIKFDISKIPTRYKPRPMFTFCTRTVYVGTDFYSPDSTTIILSDPNIQSLAVDISIDLPQIMGRQRRDDNPWKCEGTLFHKSLRSSNVITEEEFLNTLRDKRNNTDTLLNIYNNLQTDQERTNFIRKMINDIRTSKYAFDFVGFSKKTGKLTNNKLVEIAFKRAWQVSQVEFDNLLKVISDNTLLDNDDDFIIEVNNFINQFNSLSLFPDKMKLYADSMDSKNNDGSWREAINQRIKDPKYDSYYNHFGSSKALSNIRYREKDIITSINNNFLLLNNVSPIIYGAFKVGDKYLLSDIKTVLQKIYNDNGIRKKAKASDLENWFNVKKITTTSSGKNVSGYKILGQK